MSGKVLDSMLTDHG
jgi:hypothetical protein